MVGHDEPAIAIAALIAWGFAMAALGLDWKPSRSRGTGALDVGRVRALVDAT